MNALLRIIRLLAIVVWVGGLIFFAFVVAPTAFGVLPSKHEAGLVVAGTLAELHQMASICGLLFITFTALLTRTAAPRQRRLLAIQGLIVLSMMLASTCVQKKIVPQMEQDRIAAGGDIDAAPPDNPARQDFERLHPTSEKIEGAVLFLGLAVVILMALEQWPASDPVTH
jgi:uncharacterized membrane protein